ncbi:unnamed protein product [Amoebophrya sp. A25]|nr:unnamed protein product [Amoebophrya sp. A25]|eukprot:GSA25T00026304001.1
MNFLYSLRALGAASANLASAVPGAALSLMGGYVCAAAANITWASDQLRAIRTGELLAQRTAHHYLVLLKFYSTTLARLFLIALLLGEGEWNVQRMKNGLVLASAIYLAFQLAEIARCSAAVMTSSFRALRVLQALQNAEQHELRASSVPRNSSFTYSH